ncbi:MAG: GtrA family protein [Rhizomicrobium sp.]
MRNIFQRLSASRFLRFAAVGAAGFFVNEAALALAHELLGAGPRVGWFIAFVPAVTFTWWGNRKLTFADKASDGHVGMLAEWARFVATNGIGAAANFAIYAALIGLAPFPLNIPYVALAVGILVGLVFNFTLSKRLVFRGGA